MYPIMPISIDLDLEALSLLIRLLLFVFPTLVPILLLMASYYSTTTAIRYRRLLSKMTTSRIDVQVKQGSGYSPGGENNLQAECGSSDSDDDTLFDSDEDEVHTPIVIPANSDPELNAANDFEGSSAERYEDAREEVDTPPSAPMIPRHRPNAGRPSAPMPVDIESLLTRANAMSQAHMAFVEDIGDATFVRQGGVPMERSRQSRGHRRSPSLHELRRSIHGGEVPAVSLNRRYGYLQALREPGQDAVRGQRALRVAMSMTGGSLERLAEAQEDREAEEER
ncbi:hypothetical protein I316_01242 [Kwoniella heveanensis BCC8398]|uniref:Uncharacterized protein n=1 Tax=Kwoniella heveanensis BCC8398 TaxID=1296120 RepID=A0A1B9H229_9TREE|nr:hypothetical protein I316_01242 [Kwoniella heveanensis BCC8398]